MNVLDFCVGVVNEVNVRRKASQSVERLWLQPQPRCLVDEKLNIDSRNCMHANRQWRRVVLSNDRFLFMRKLRWIATSDLHSSCQRDSNKEHACSRRFFLPLPTDSLFVFSVVLDEKWTKANDFVREFTLHRCWCNVCDAMLLIWWPPELCIRVFGVRVNHRWRRKGTTFSYWDENRLTAIWRTGPNDYLPIQ